MIFNLGTYTIVIIDPVTKWFWKTLFAFPIFWSLHCISSIGCYKQIFGKQTWLVFKFSVWVEGYLVVGVETESSRDLKSWAKSRASQNRSDQSFLQCTAHNTISTFDLFQSLHNVKMVLGACIELLQDASTLMQEGKLCRYVYTERILQICIQTGRTYIQSRYTERPHRG